jgi:carbamoyl-phosphate synthase large subunit
MRILITGAGGPSAISVWKSLSADHEIHMADIDPCAAGLYLVPEGRRLIVPRGDSPKLAPALLEACRARSIELLLPTVDSEFVPLATVRGDFEAMGVALPISPLDALRVCRDKDLLISRLRGLAPVPESEPMTAEVAARVSSFPRFVKPRSGAGSRGAVKIDSREELEALPKDGSLLLQEYLPGEEYSVDVYVHSDGRVMAAVPRERMKTDSGVAVTARTLNKQELIESAVRVAEVIGVRYVANIQFKRAADGIFKLLEINPRFPGTLPLTTAAGVDMPKMMIDDVAGKKMPDGLLPFKEIMVVRYWTEHYFDQAEWERMCRQ